MSWCTEADEGYSETFIISDLTVFRIVVGLVIGLRKSLSTVAQHLAVVIGLGLN
jgi:hypothetical protein